MLPRLSCAELTVTASPRVERKRRRVCLLLSHFSIPRILLALLCRTQRATFTAHRLTCLPCPTFCYDRRGRSRPWHQDAANVR